ncbi:LuxR C-terminal-related transcriptional regulator [Kitasatospora sp. NPDC059327]|uniref:LuxR C-terminal-related transcriptional regulator n=1 Tax=Kitasatospora sp. NPDC059327 TaxID=3346803 RepID=UPI00367D056B
MKRGLCSIDEDLALRAYERLLVTKVVTPAELAADLGITAERAEQALSALRCLKLVRYCPEQGRYAARSPEIAQLELLMPLEQSIREKRRELTDVQDVLSSFADTYSNLQRTRLRRDPVLSGLDREQTGLRMADALRDRPSEILVMEPFAPVPGQDSHALGLSSLPSGVPIQVLYPHTARSSLASRGSLRTLAEASARVRTSTQAFERLVIVGGEVAFLADPGGDDAGVTVVYEPAIVARLVRSYEHAWASGTDIDSNVVRYGETLDEVRCAILELLASGLKDEVVARRIGMSSRTFRRHLATIMDELNAESRFQAGAAAVQAGLLPVRAAAG